MPQASFVDHFGGTPFTLRIDRPSGLADENWEAIENAGARLGRAIEAGDLSLCVGSAKELVEATGKVVLDAQGHAVASNQGFPEVISEAHRKLDRQPGHGLATEAPVRDVAAQLVRYRAWETVRS